MKYVKEPAIPICGQQIRDITAPTQKRDDAPNEVMPHHAIYLCDYAS